MLLVGAGLSPEPIVSQRSAGPWRLTPPAQAPVRQTAPARRRRREPQSSSSRPQPARTVAAAAALLAALGGGRWRRHLAGKPLAAWIQRRRSRDGSRLRPLWRRGTAADSSDASSIGAQADQFKAAIEVLPFRFGHLSAFVGAFMSYLVMGHASDGIGLAFPEFSATFSGMHPNRLSLTVITLTLGFGISSVGGGYLADRFGRRSVLRWCMPIGLVAQALCTVAPTFDTLLVSRFIAGAALGITTVVAPTLFSEICPASARWLLVCYQQGWVVGVILYTIFISYFGWREAFAVVIPFSIVFLLLILVPGGLPESPKFLCDKGSMAEAEHEFKRLGGKFPLTAEGDGSEPAPKTDGEGAIASKPEQQSFREMMMQMPLLRMVLIRCALVLWCQGAGTQSMKTWLPVVLQSRGIQLHSGGETAVTFCLMSLLELAGAWVLQYLTARAVNQSSEDSDAGQEAEAPSFILRLGQVGSLLAALSVVAVFWARTPTHASVLGGLHLLWQGTMFVYVFSYATLRFPPAVRGRCVAICMLMSCLGTTVGPLLTAELLEVLPPLLGPPAVLLLISVFYFTGFLTSLGLGRHEARGGQARAAG